MLRFDMYALGLTETERARQPPAAVGSRPGSPPIVLALEKRNQEVNQRPAVVVGPDGRHLLGYTASREVRRIPSPHNLVHLTFEQASPD